MSQGKLTSGCLQVKLGGLDVYSGYWLAADSPAANVEDPLQEEGIDTLRRIMDAAGIVMSGKTTCQYVKITAELVHRNAELKGMVQNSS